MKDIKYILNNQIEIAETLLQRASSIPDGNPHSRIAGAVRYYETVTQPLQKDVEEWQTETTEYLRLLYGEDARQVSAFERCINNKNHFINFRDEIQNELQDCISKLKAFVKTELLKQMMTESDNNRVAANPKTPMVFISHSSKDKEFVEALVTLLESIGFDNKTMFCSSIPDYWIGLSQNIFESLRSLFDNHQLFVIFIQSPRYYESPISLNEMGAAWVLQTDCCSILTKDMQREMMRGVVDDRTIYIKVDSPEATSRMNELKNKLVDMFGLLKMLDSTWERKRNTFLKAACGIEYEESVTHNNQVSEEYMALQIKKMRQEEEDRKKAVIRANIVSRGGGSRILHITNQGKSKATNIHVDMPNPKQVYDIRPNIPCEIDQLLPGTNREFRLFLCEGDDVLTLNFSWQDDYSNENKESQTIDL